jgi:hypothetical protein
MYASVLLRVWACVSISVFVWFEDFCDLCRAKDGSTLARDEEIERKIIMIVRYRGAIFMVCQVDPIVAKLRELSKVKLIFC